MCNQYCVVLLALKKVTRIMTWVNTDKTTQELWVSDELCNCEFNTFVIVVGMILFVQKLLKYYTESDGTKGQCRLINQSIGNYNFHYVLFNNSTVSSSDIGLFSFRFFHLGLQRQFGFWYINKSFISKNKYQRVFVSYLNFLRWPTYFCTYIQSVRRYSPWWI